jgi:L-aminopeptidase/D-esterase-like protein
MDKIPVTAIPGFRLGNAHNLAAATGCTVILCPEGAVAGVDVRGGAPGTRETDLLRPENYVEKIHAVTLAGGSAFGLDAASGVMAWLEERGLGFDVGIAKVPIVAGAVLFDLPCGDPMVRPDKAMGYAACLAAEKGAFAEGTAGAGAGAYQSDPFAFLGSEDGMVARYGRTGNLFAGNTTIGAVLTNAALTKAQAAKVASMAHNGYARTMRPAHTSVVGLLAARVVGDAVLRAVTEATSLAGFKARRDLKKD